MPQRFLIRQLSDGSSEWLALSREGTVLQGPAAGLPSGQAEETVLLLPGTDVLLLEAPRVSRSAAQLAQALPFAIEEQLAAPIESVHVAFDAHVPGDSVPCAVIAKARLREVLERLQAAGISVDRCYSELQCLPHEATACHVDGHVLLRWGRSAALALEASAWPALQDWLATQGFEAAQARQIAVADAQAAGAEAVDAFLPWLAQQLPHAAAIDLLQGEFRPRRRSQALGRAWRFAAALAAAAILFGFALVALERRALDAHVEARQTEMAELLRTAVPGTQRVVDPQAQLRAALQQAGGARGSDALGLIGRIAPALGGSTRFTLEGLEYRGGTLELTIVASDVASLDGLREQLASLAPWSVELTSAVPGTRGVEGRLRIREGRS